MKIYGGYLPKITGRPSSTVDELQLPQELSIDLCRGGISYNPVVKNGQRVDFGETLAETSVLDNRLCLPAPAGGTVALHDENTVVLENLQGQINPGTSYRPERISREQTIKALSEGGVWPFFWSSKTGGVPSPGADELPQAIVINVVISEPFRTRGKVILRRSWKRIVEGIKFLPRLIADYGIIYIVLTQVRDPIAQMMVSDLAGFAWIRFRPVPLRYPVENQRVLFQAFQKSEASIHRDSKIWITDVQGIEAVGACLADGLPVHQRVVVASGPGHADPRHLAVRIGTPVGAFSQSKNDRPVRILRGGVFTGQPADPAKDAVQYDDDGFFFLPEVTDREFLSFLRPGFDRTSYSRTFASSLFGGRDRRLSTSLRGERRPCITCGACENICPARVLPQVLHRYIHRELYEEAEKAGLNACVECGLCSHVCPSKLELLQQFVDAKALLQAEREEAMETAGRGE
ncbi:MAG: 4Fe-4S dicluster domain-containing protein [Spirochaetaceae bacterium]|nr:MAG: 4Fe-4S dicluster domain-containing protein [Spirochaetaceae bacterium]